MKWFSPFSNAEVEFGSGLCPRRQRSPVSQSGRLSQVSWNSLITVITHIFCYCQPYILPHLYGFSKQCLAPWILVLNFVLFGLLVFKKQLLVYQKHEVNIYLAKGTCTFLYRRDLFSKFVTLVIKILIYWFIFHIINMHKDLAYQWCP